MSSRNVLPEDLSRFIEDIQRRSPGNVSWPEPAFERYRKNWLDQVDLNALKAYTPQQLINAARTQDELFFIGDYLYEQYGRGQSWWNYHYHKRRLELGHRPSFYGFESELMIKMDIRYERYIDLLFDR